MGIDPHIPVRLLRAFPGGPREFGSELLRAHIPMTNPNSSAPVSHISYETYLKGILNFIFENGNNLLEILSQYYASSNVTALDIISEKHGQDYHPARLVVHTDRDKISFAVNVAMTDRAGDRLREDFRCLNHLERKHGAEFIPRAYFLGEQILPNEHNSRHEATMFLAQWLEGYHEFHLSSVSPDASHKAPSVVLWDFDHGYTKLSSMEAGEIFRRAAFIFTVFYDLETFEEVFPWHHASGDFVVSRNSSGIDVKLITVRQYASRTVFHDTSIENRVTALLIFLANLTIRMRLDRFDGTGEIAWAGPECVAATICGFLEGMRSKVQKEPSAAIILDAFWRMVNALSVAESAHVFQMVTESYDAAAPDIPVIAVNLVEHVYQVYEVLRAMSPYKP